MASCKFQVVSGKLQVASCKWQVASCKWQANRVMARILGLMRTPGSVRSRPKILSHSLGFAKEKKVRSGRELLICTAAKGEKVECGRTTFLADTAANEKRQSCGRANCSFRRPQIGKRRNAAVLPTLPIRPQLEKDRAAAVRISHLYGRK